MFTCSHIAFVSQNIGQHLQEMCLSFLLLPCLWLWPLLLPSRGKLYFWVHCHIFHVWKGLISSAAVKEMQKEKELLLPFSKCKPIRVDWERPDWLSSSVWLHMNTQSRMVNNLHIPMGGWCLHIVDLFICHWKYRCIISTYVHGQIQTWILNEVMSTTYCLQVNSNPCCTSRYQQHYCIM